MMKKKLAFRVCLIVVLLLSIFAIVMWFPFAAAEDIVTPSETQNHSVRKIVLGTFKAHDDKAAPGNSNDLDWLKMSGRGMAFDDENNIYVLNDTNNSVLVFDENGNRKRTVDLANVVSDTKMFTLSVTGDGEYIYVGIFSEHTTGTYLFDKDGIFIQSFGGNRPWLIRMCGDKFKSYPAGPTFIDDKNMKLLDLPRIPNIYFDSEGKYILNGYNGEIIKYSPFGYPVLKRFIDVDSSYSITRLISVPLIDRIVWSKKPPAYAAYFGGGIGFDKNDNYVTNILGKDGRRYIARLDKEGSINAIAQMDDEVFIPSFLSELNKNNEMLSETYNWPFNHPYLVCSGSVFMIYNLPALSEKALDRWMESGEYYIYRIDFDK